MPSWLFKGATPGREVVFHPFDVVDEGKSIDTRVALRVAYNGRARAYASISAADMDRLCDDWQAWKAKRSK